MIQVENYQASGFELFDTTKRYRLSAMQMQHLNYDKLENTTLHKSVNFAELLAYDKSIFSQNRQSFLQCWLQLPEAKLIVAKNKNAICGYGFLVKSDVSYRLVPLFADDVKLAKAILGKLCLKDVRCILIYQTVICRQKALSMNEG